jgi:hypothetical protein
VDVLRSPVQQDLPDVPFPLKGVGKVYGVGAPDDIVGRMNQHLGSKCPGNVREIRSFVTFVIRNLCECPTVKV